MGSYYGTSCVNWGIRMLRYRGEHLMPRITVEVVGRRWTYGGITGVNRSRTCLFVIIAGTIRFPVNECSSQRRDYRDIVRMVLWSLLPHSRQ
jgi:hypothetical protein